MEDSLQNGNKDFLGQPGGRIRKWKLAVLSLMGGAGFFFISLGYALCVQQNLNLKITFTFLPVVYIDAILESWAFSSDLMKALSGGQHCFLWSKVNS